MFAAYAYGKSLIPMDIGYMYMYMLLVRLTRATCMYGASINHGLIDWD